MKIRVFQKGFNYSQDGPGNRLVYHLQGCNLHCPWCSNPEGMPPEGGTAYEVGALVEEAVRSKKMFFDGGGVTLTGGEPTVQFDAVKLLFEGLSGEGIHVALETNGTAKRLPELFDNLNFLMVDCKHYDDFVLKQWTGLGNTTVLNNIQAALNRDFPVIVRIPLIGGFNASVEDANGFAELFRSFGREERFAVELLSYHEYGKSKWESIGKEYAMKRDAFVDEAAMAEFERIFRDNSIARIRT